MIFIEYGYGNPNNYSEKYASTLQELLEENKE